MIGRLLWLALLAAACPAFALNMTGFKDAPITRLTGDELKAFRAAVMKVLDEGPSDGGYPVMLAPLIYVWPCTLSGAG
jgi:hypothetical protein